MNNTFNKGPMLNWERREPISIIQSYTFKTVEEFQNFWKQLSDEDKANLAQAYISAFEGPPWFEVDVYDPNILVGEYFPQSLETVPSILSLLYLTTEEKQKFVAGACFGTKTTLEKLVAKKYNSNPEILSTLQNIAGASQQDKMLYDNENFIDRRFQGKGFGAELNRKYFETMRQNRVEQFIWRTINVPWGKLKSEQAISMGYNVYILAVPDNFQVNGVQTPRLVYYCVKVNDGQSAQIIDLTENL